MKMTHDGIDLDAYNPEDVPIRKYASGKTFEEMGERLKTYMILAGLAVIISFLIR